MTSSATHNTIGGATGSGSPTPGDWQGILVQNGGSIDLKHANMRYATISVLGQRPGPVVLDTESRQSHYRARSTLTRRSAPSHQPGC